MANTTRDRIITTTAGLLRRQGYAGTGLKQIAKDSDTAFGSLYHFFPDGKEQLAAETLRWAGRGYQLLVEAVLGNAPDVVSGAADVFTGAAEVLRQTDYADACPIETVALEVASSNEALRQVTAEVFEGWAQAGTTYFVSAGIAAATARELSLTLIGALEGAFVLCRAMKSTEPMEAAGRAVTVAVRRALEATP